MRSVLSLSWYPRRLLPPEVPLAGILAAILIVVWANLLAPVHRDQVCTPTPANRAIVLCTPPSPASAKH